MDESNTVAENSKSETIKKHYGEIHNDLQSIFDGARYVESIIRHSERNGMRDVVALLVEQCAHAYKLHFDMIVENAKAINNTQDEEEK